LAVLYLRRAFLMQFFVFDTMNGERHILPDTKPMLSACAVYSALSLNVFGLGEVAEPKAKLKNKS